MNCHRVVNLMSAYVDGELTGAEMLAIRRHISDCEECMEEYDALKFTKQMIANLGTVTPRKEFAAVILSRLDEVEIPSYQRAINSIMSFVHKKLSPVVAALAASGVALVILSAGGGMDRVGTQSVPVASNPSYTVSAQNVSFNPQSSGNILPISNSKPLVVANMSPELSGTSLELVSYPK